jgi:NADH:ubiquinone oxidoreductase subunit K
MTLDAYLTLSAVLFSMGVFGAVTRKSMIAVLMALELMFNAAIINLAAFSHFLQPPAPTGQVFGLFVIAVAAAETTVGVALALAVFRNRLTIDTTSQDLMKG